MQPRLVLGSLTAWILAACSAPTEPAAKTELKSEPKSEPKRKPKPEQLSMTLDGAPVVPPVEVLTPVGECPALAALSDDAPEPQRKTVPELELLRALACQPALFGQSTPAIRAALQVPQASTLEIDRADATVSFTESVEVGDLLEVLGIPDTNLRFVLSSNGLYSLVDASRNRPSAWPPSELRIEFLRDPPVGMGYGSTHYRPIPDPAEIEYDPQRTITHLTIELPESALAFEYDEFAAVALLEALSVLALADAPHEVGIDQLPSLGERYRIDAWQSQLEPGEMFYSKVVYLHPKRTELLASDLAQIMGLPSPTHELSEHEFDVLTSAGDTEFVWRGLSVGIGLSKRPGVHEGLAGWTVSGVGVERAAPSP